MATDVDVQYFSHLNGLVLDNNWGDMIRLLDTCLVNGLPLTDVQSAVITPEGNIQITTMSDHKCMLFQIIELSGYTPNKFNGRYRIMGVPESTVLILRADWDVEVIQSVGNTRLAPLGYEIIFRDDGDVKRVYRAVNPRAEHPYIRVDESITSDTGDYTATYVKSAMVGLLEHMDHIDDYGNPEVLQLPFDSANPTKNWDINGTGTGVIRGWAKWYYASNTWSNCREDYIPIQYQREFTLCGDSNAFYFMINKSTVKQIPLKFINACGLLDSNNHNTKDWFLSAKDKNTTAGATKPVNGDVTGSFLAHSLTSSKFFITKNTNIPDHIPYTWGNPVLFNYTTGAVDITPLSTVPAVGIPVYGDDGYLRGNLYHIYFAAKTISVSKTTPILDGSDMYITDSIHRGSNSNYIGAVYFYLGEL